MITQWVPGLVKGVGPAVFLPRGRFSRLQKVCLSQPWRQSPASDLAPFQGERARVRNAEGDYDLTEFHIGKKHWQDL